jgi:hypothetical protein
MRRSWITLGALFACVIALGLFVWLKPPKPPQATYAVSTLKSLEAHRIRVLHKGQPPIALEKRGGEWALTEPVKGPADTFQVLRLLAILDAKSPLHYPPAELAKFELDAPQVQVIINDQRFAFGAINTVTREQYVLTQNTVYPLEPRYGAAVPASAQALLRRSVLAPEDSPVHFEFGTFSVATTPPAGELSQDTYNHWVAQWRAGSALRTELLDKRKPQSEVRITLKNGTKVALDIVQVEPELIVRRADLGLQFVFVGDMGNQMMSPPAARK